MGTFFIIVLVCIMIGAGIVALMNTEAGEVGCGCIAALFGLFLIGLVTLFFGGLLGIGCMAAMH